MSSLTLFRERSLEETVAAHNDQVRQTPTDVDARYRLFVLLAMAGELERAALQLDAIAHIDTDAALGTAVYHQLLASEKCRKAVFLGTGESLLPPDADLEHLERQRSFRRLACGDEGAATFFEERAGSSSGTEFSINGHQYGALSDLDDFLGPVLEVFAGGNYLWLPFDHISQLEVHRPASLIDLLWVPADLVDQHGLDASVHLPVMYHGSHRADDEEVRLGRRTEWRDIGGAGFRGFGQKVFGTGNDEPDTSLAILEIQSLENNSCPSPSRTNLPN